MRASGAQPVFDLTETLENLATIEAIYRSARLSLANSLKQTVKELCYAL